MTEKGATEDDATDADTADDDATDDDATDANARDDDAADDDASRDDRNDGAGEDKGADDRGATREDDADKFSAGDAGQLRGRRFDAIGNKEAKGGSGRSVVCVKDAEDEAAGRGSCGNRLEGEAAEEKRVD